ncbi:MAG TPA: hypothetical protein VK402_01880 [Blastococcus sp.]|nr:hypothetical protein [Blastococcus sp.]
MSDPVPGSRETRRERVLALLLLGVAAVLLVSSVTWFSTGQQVVGIGQLVVAALLAAVAVLLLRRSRRT